MYRLSDIQAVEPEALPRDWTDRSGAPVLVEVSPELDSQGFERVDLVSPSNEAILDYVIIHWGGSSADPEWFQSYIVERVTVAPITFDQYVADVAAAEAERHLDAEPADILLTRGDLRVIEESLDLLSDLDEGENTDDERLRALASYIRENLVETERAARESQEELASL